VCLQRGQTPLRPARHVAAAAAAGSRWLALAPVSLSQPGAAHLPVHHHTADTDVSRFSSFVGVVSHERSLCRVVLSTRQPTERSLM